MVLVVSFRDQQQRPVLLELMEPSGMVRSGEMFCIGMNSKILQTELFKAFSSTDNGDLESLLLDTFSSAQDHNEPLQLEFFSAHGIERQRLRKSQRMRRCCVRPSNIRSSSLCTKIFTFQKLGCAIKTCNLRNDSRRPIFKLFLLVRFTIVMPATANPQFRILILLQAHECILARSAASFR